LGFKLPDDKQYQFVGVTTPDNFSINADNLTFINHMILYGCKTPPRASMMEEPYLCSLSDYGCTSILAIWAPGFTGLCYPNEYGIAFGMGSGYTYAALEVIYNNPQQHTGLQHGPVGFKLYYTSNIRQNNAMIVMTGQEYIKIPPHQSEMTVSGTCVSECTQLLPQVNYSISFAILHMHLLGQSGTVEILKDHQRQETIVNQTNYDYYQPASNMFDPPIQFQPGDEIRTNCVYSSLSKNTITTWGLSAEFEMCYSFVLIYPAVDNFDYCMQWQDIGECDIDIGLSYQDCDGAALLSSIPAVLNSCNVTACEFDRACQDVIANVSRTGCISGKEWQYIQWDWSNDGEMVTMGAVGFFDLANKCGGFVPLNLTDIL